MITIKGYRDGLLVMFDQQPWITQVRELENKFQANTHFFKGGRIAIDVKTLSLSQEDITRFMALLAQYEVSLWAVLSHDEGTIRNVHSQGIPTTIIESLPIERESIEVANTSDPETASIDYAHPEGTDGLLVRKRVRSGQVLRHPGHIVVLGDVNPGSQLIAGGDIIVWGKLHGAAHAGALGDSSAVICALELAPSLIKIAEATRSNSHITTKRVRSKHPESAILDHDEIKIIAWVEK